MLWLWIRTWQREWRREADYWCKAQGHCRHYEDLEGGTRRYKGGRASLPLPYVGKGFPVTFIVNNGSQKNLISVDIVKWLVLPTIAHPQPYTIEWIHQGQDLYVSQHCHFPYNIKPFTYEVLCDITPLDVCDVLLGQPYFWKWHVVYESWPHAIIFTLGNNLYMILEVLPLVTISLVTPKKWSNIIWKPGKFVILMIRPHRKKNNVAKNSRQGSSAWQQ